MKIKLLTMLLIGLFGLVGVSSVAVARDDCGGCSLEGNAIALEEAIKQTAEALELAKQGKAEETNTVSRAARQSLKLIVTTRGGRLLQKPRTNITKAGIAARKGNIEDAVPLLEEALALLKTVDLTPE